jgi:hypothetical protein
MLHEPHQAKSWMKCGSQLAVQKRSLNKGLNRFLIPSSSAFTIIANQFQ